LPAFGDVAGQLAIQCGGQLTASFARQVRIVAVRIDEQTVGVAVEHIETGRLEPPLRPQQDLAAHTGDRVG